AARPGGAVSQGCLPSHRRRRFGRGGAVSGRQSSRRESASRCAGTTCPGLPTDGARGRGQGAAIQTTDPNPARRDRRGQEVTRSRRVYRNGLFRTVAKEDEGATEGNKIGVGPTRSAQIQRVGACS